MATPVPGKDFPDPKDPKEVSPRGTIVRPGKFEGEMYYVPYFWDQGGDEDVDDPAGMVYSVVKFSPVDRAQFPEIKRDDFALWMYERDDGFVIGEVVTKKRAEQLRKEIDAAWESQSDE